MRIVMVNKDERLRCLAREQAPLDLALVQPALVDGMIVEHRGTLHLFVQLQLPHEARVRFAQGPALPDPRQRRCRRDMKLLHQKGDDTCTRS